MHRLDQLVEGRAADSARVSVRPRFASRRIKTSRGQHKNASAGTSDYSEPIVFRLATSPCTRRLKPCEAGLNIIEFYRLALRIQNAAHVAPLSWGDFSSSDGLDDDAKGFGQTSNGGRVRKLNVDGAAGQSFPVSPINQHPNRRQARCLALCSGNWLALTIPE